MEVEADADALMIKCSNIFLALAKRKHIVLVRKEDCKGKENIRQTSLCSRRRTRGSGESCAQESGAVSERKRKRNKDNGMASL